MPIYEYRCGEGHIQDGFRAIAERDNPVTCYRCGGKAKRIQSVPAKRTDGIYSYDENIGNPELVEKAEARERGETWDSLANPTKPE